MLPDREKLYLRCYRASGRTNSLCNFFWRFYVPSEDENEDITEAEYTPIADLLKIRFADEVIVKQNKEYTGSLSLSSEKRSKSEAPLGASDNMEMGIVRDFLCACSYIA